MTSADSNSSGRRALWTYLIVAYGVSWLCWMPSLVLSTREGYPLPTIDRLISQPGFAFADTRHVALSALFSLAVYGPLLGGIVATRFSGERQSILEFWRRVAKWRIAPRWYLCALLLAIAMPLLPLAIALLTGVASVTRRALCSSAPDQRAWGGAGLAWLPAAHDGG